MFSRFVIELTPRLKEIGLVTSVDVTAPDGGETWSMCFDRNVIGDAADYIVFMAYDQYGVSSTKPGTTAGYDWVKLSLNKFLKTEENTSRKNNISSTILHKSLDNHSRRKNNVKYSINEKHRNSCARRCRKKMGR